jgi:hypothetical protein
MEKAGKNTEMRRNAPECAGKPRFLQNIWRAWWGAPPVLYFMCDPSGLDAAIAR